MQAFNALIIVTGQPDMPSMPSRPVDPGFGMPTLPPHVWPMPLPGLPHPGGGPMPGGPAVTLPIVIPPEEIPPGPIPDDKLLVCAMYPGVGVKCKLVDKPPGYVDNTLPGGAQPK